MDPSGVVETHHEVGSRPLQNQEPTLGKRQSPGHSDMPVSSLVKQLEANNLDENKTSNNNEECNDDNGNVKQSDNSQHNNTAGSPDENHTPGETKLDVQDGDDINEENGTDEVNDDDSDEDGDPIPSGTGAVSRDCTASELIGWSELLPRWHSKLDKRPKGLDALVRNGIPEPLRGEVWQLLSGAQQCSDLMEHYRIFLTKSAPTEQIILRDVHRTYPAHENFRSGGGSSSLLDSLFKVCKAYAVYDAEVGYCQGLSFLVAALLLHMPEEQAFCVFVRIMKHYGLRDLFRNNFDELYLKFYQLERLLEDHMPDLHQHFVRIGIEPFTYASQWFLTVFTAKFPLNAVFYIMDIFLLDGMNTIFQIALALLDSSKQELLASDFEGVLKYFRVQMPKRYRNQENVQQLISISSGISLRKLKKHAKNYEVVKQKERLMENPVARLQKENAKLTENNIRLEQENDDLARDLVASKIQLRAQLDLLEDKTETLNRALTYSRQDCQTYLATISDIEDEKSRLEVEVAQLKEVCRRELNRAETELARDNSIIADYKKITSSLSKRMDRQMELIEKSFESTSDLLRGNESCESKQCHEIFQSRSRELLDMLRLPDDQLPQKENESPKSVASNNSDKMRRVSAESEHSNRPVGAYIKSTDSLATSGEAKMQQLSQHVDELEIELAKTKLALVEAECKCQQLTHDLNLGVTVKTPSTIGQQHNSGSLTGSLDFVKAAMSNRRSPNVASNALAKINNLISNIGAHPTPSSPTTGSTTLTAPNPTHPVTSQPNSEASKKPAHHAVTSTGGDSPLPKLPLEVKPTNTIDQC